MRCIQINEPATARQRTTSPLGLSRNSQDSAFLPSGAWVGCWSSNHQVFKCKHRLNPVALCDIEFQPSTHALQVETLRDRTESGVSAGVDRCRALAPRMATANCV